MLSAPGRRLVFDAHATGWLVGLEVVGPLSVTSCDTKHLSRVRTVRADASNALGFLAHQTHPIVRCDSLAVSGTKLGIVDVTGISLGLGRIVKGLPVLRTGSDSVGTG